MKNIFYFLIIFASSCGNTTNKEATPATQTTAAVEETSPEAAKARQFAGAFSNGMKGDSIFFDISADGKRLENLTFKGYWRCSGRLEQTTVGPEGSYTIKDGKVSGHITEPPGGGSTAWRFELDGAIQSNKASGTFRMNINNLGCDTYKLQWTAVPKK